MNKIEQRQKELLEAGKEAIEELEEKEALQKISKIKIPEEQAKEEWKRYVEVLKTRQEKYLKVMKSAMYHMKNGKELIDIYKVMKEVGLTEKGQPRLAIARADLKEVVFRKRDEGSGIFATGMSNRWSSDIEWNKDLIELPQHTFNIHWEREENSSSIVNRHIKTKVPIIPIQLLPEGDLSNYFILWEANNWEELPETKDPILLKRISENLFVVLGSWDLTPLEQSIIGGRY